jgi:hypothetical protein
MRILVLAMNSIPSEMAVEVMVMVAALISIICVEGVVTRTPSKIEDEEFEDHDYEEGSDENPFANDGVFGRCHHHRHADFEDRD